METKIISNPRIAVEMMQDRFKDIDHEELWGIFVGLRNEQIACKMLSSGGWTSTTIDLRQIFSVALENKAVGIILFHNHHRQKWEMIRSNAGRKDKVAEIQQIDIESGSVVATYMMRKDIIAKTGIKKSHLAQCIKTAKENPGNRNEWKKWKGSDGKLYGFAESQ